MNPTNIEWTTFSANPLKYRRKADGKTVWGCVKVSPGCRWCYAEALALRYERGKVFNAASMEELESFLDEEELRKMRTARTVGGIPVVGSRCFVGDMTDVFGEWVSDDLLNRLFSSVLEMRTDVVWQLLTKRAERMRAYLAWRWGEGRIPCRNINLGVSVEDQERADERIPLLLQTPAAVRFLSCEPLLGPMDLCRYLRPVVDEALDCPAGVEREFFSGRWPGIDWVIVGSESGPKARPMEESWVRSICDQCLTAKMPFFYKQNLSGGKKVSLPLLDGRKFSEFPSIGLDRP
jgi:protein gp37